MVSDFTLLSSHAHNFYIRDSLVEIIITRHCYMEKFPSRNGRGKRWEIRRKLVETHSKRSAWSSGIRFSLTPVANRTNDLIPFEI